MAAEDCCVQGHKLGTHPRLTSWAGLVLGGWWIFQWCVLREWKCCTFWLVFGGGLRNSFAPLLFHTIYMVGLTLDFNILLTLLKEYNKVDWIWAVPCPIFQIVYFQLMHQILFKAFHSFVYWHFFYSEIVFPFHLPASDYLHAHFSNNSNNKKNRKRTALVLVAVTFHLDCLDMVVAKFFVKCSALFSCSAQSGQLWSASQQLTHWNTSSFLG